MEFYINKLIIEIVFAAACVAVWVFCFTFAGANDNLAAMFGVGLVVILGLTLKHLMDTIDFENYHKYVLRLTKRDDTE